MGRALKAGACVVALAAFVPSGAFARHGGHAGRCARSDEVTAIAATSVQQQLMVAALTCNQVARFNQFQTNFGPELRISDRTLMRMFLRLYGRRGAAEYHAFKTRLANNSEMRSIRGNHVFCEAASGVFEAALAPAKPSLAAFVSQVPVEDPSPVDSCQMTVATGLQGAMAVPAIYPTPKPAQFVDVSLATPPPPQPAAVASTPQPTPAAASPEKTKKGFFAGMFN